MRRVNDDKEDMLLSIAQVLLRPGRANELTRLESS